MTIWFLYPILCIHTYKYWCFLLWDTSVLQCLQSLTSTDLNWPLNSTWTKAFLHLILYIHTLSMELSMLSLLEISVSNFDLWWPQMTSELHHEQDLSLSIWNISMQRRMIATFLKITCPEPQLFPLHWLIVVGILSTIRTNEMDYQWYILVPGDQRLHFTPKWWLFIPYRQTFMPFCFFCHTRKPTGPRIYDHWLVSLVKYHTAMYALNCETYNQSWTGVKITTLYPFILRNATMLGTHVWSRCTL